MNKRQYECLDCHWQGTHDELVRGYDYGNREMEPFVLCPKCNSFNIVEIADNGAKLELCPA